MSCVQRHALGRELRAYVKAETVCGTYIAPLDEDAIKVLSTTIDWKQERVFREDSRQTRSHITRVTRKKEVAWSIEKNLLPSGISAATVIDDFELFAAAMGAETDGASIVFSHTAVQTVPTLSITREASSVVSEAIYGAWVEDMSISVPGGEEAKVTFGGGAFDSIQTGFADLETALTGGESAFEVLAAEGENFVAGSVVMVGDSGPHVVTAVTPGTPNYTIAIGVETIVGVQAQYADIIPYVPDELLQVVDPIAGIIGSLSITPDGSDGVAHPEIADLPVTSFDVALKNNIKPIADEAFRAAVTDIIPGFREITGTISVRARRDMIVHLARRKNFQVHDVLVTIGDTAGSRVKIALPTVEFDSTTLDIPASEEGTINLPFVALATVAGEDEMTITFD